MSLCTAKPLNNGHIGTDLLSIIEIVLFQR